MAEKSGKDRVEAEEDGREFGDVLFMAVSPFAKKWIQFMAPPRRKATDT